MEHPKVRGAVQCQVVHLGRLKTHVACLARQNSCAPRGAVSGRADGEATGCEAVDEPVRPQTGNVGER
jgi:hypothetical protein